MGDDFIYLVSACLAGCKCKYNGESNEIKVIVEMVERGQAIPVCPELLGGLDTPRASCEIITEEMGNRKVISCEGKDLTKEFSLGAKKTLLIGKTKGITKAILKSKSPSCGYKFIYDGTFSGKLIPGNGFTTDLLIKNGIEVFSENDIIYKK